MNKIFDNGNCPVCLSKLKEPYINCVECQPNAQLCLRCFARGSEFGSHSSDHSYKFRSLSFPLFDDENWSARDELQLLDELEDSGFGNWQGISKRLNKKNAKEVQTHYLKNFIEDPKFPLEKVTVDTKPILRRPINFQESPCPPRPGTSSTADDDLCAIGYMPARGDFVVESDNFAECDIKDVDFTPTYDKNNNLNGEEYDELMTEMSHHIVDIFYIRQRERNLKKSLVKKYGLLDVVTSSVFYTYGREERTVRDMLRKFTQFMQPEAHEKLLQGILYQKSLEEKIERLQEYRKHGLKMFRDASFYEKLKRQRERNNKNKPFKLEEVMQQRGNQLACQVWLQKQLNKKKIYNLAIPGLNRKHLPPLEIKGLPAYEELTEAEQNICANVRTTPSDYLEYRAKLQEESFLSNGVKLATARVLLKIDVNRTKRLFEFMVNNGLIKGLPGRD